MNISVNAIKGIMSKELASHYSTACQSLPNSIQRGFLHIAYHQVIAPKLESATTYQELENVLKEMDYCMSLQEWIESL